MTGLLAYELVVASFLAVATGSTELASRFRDEPGRVIRSAPGLFYCAINVAGTWIALAFTHIFNWHLGLANSTDMALATTRALTAGVAAAVLLRSSLLNVRFGTEDVGVGPGALIMSLLRIAEEATDRRRAATRLELHLLEGLSFQDDAAHLVELCSFALQVLNLADAQALGELVAQLRRRDDLDDAAKLDRLAMALLNLVGEAALTAAADRIRGRAGAWSRGGGGDDTPGGQATEAPDSPEARINVLTKAIDQEPGIAGLYAARARWWHASGFDEEAIADLTRAVALAPDDVEIGLARAHYGNVSLGTLRRLLGRCAEDSPQEAMARVMFVRVLLASAISRASLPDSSVIRLPDATADFVREPIREAEECLDKLLKSPVSNGYLPEVSVLRSVTRLIQNDPLGAAEELYRYPRLGRLAVLQAYLAAEGDANPEVVKLRSLAIAMYPDLKRALESTTPNLPWQGVVDLLMKESFGPVRSAVSLPVQGSLLVRHQAL